MMDTEGVTPAHWIPMYVRQLFSLRNVNQGRCRILLQLGASMIMRVQLIETTVRLQTLLERMHYGRGVGSQVEC